MFLSMNKLLEVALGFCKPCLGILDLAVRICSSVILAVYLGRCHFDWVCQLVDSQLSNH